MKSSLFFRLIGAFVLVILVAVAVTYLLANRVTAGHFHLYVTRGSQLYTLRLAPLLADYYAQTGGWQDVERLLETPWGGAMIGPGMRRGGTAGRRIWIAERVVGGRLVLADATGRVVADTGGELAGQELSEAERRDSTPIVVDGQQVGTLVASIESSGQETLEDKFLRSVQRSLLLAGLATGVIALALGSFLLLQMAKQSQGR